MAERELDLAVALREFTDELAAGDARALARSRAKLLAALTGTDPEAIWEWDAAAGRLHLDVARRCLPGSSPQRPAQCIVEDRQSLVRRLHAVEDRLGQARHQAGQDRGLQLDVGAGGEGAGDVRS